MTSEGPLLEALTHRVSEIQPEFLLVPKGSPHAEASIDITAIVCDHFRAMGAPLPTSAQLKQIAGDGSFAAIPRLRVIAIAIWLLHDESLRSRKELAAAMVKLIAEELDDLASVVKPESIVNDPDRREEFVRVCLKYLGLRPKGETEFQATDRLNTLDSAERLKVVRQSRAAEARARKIREQLAAEAAKAAASRYTPE